MDLSIQIPDAPDVLHSFLPLFRVFKDGRVERFSQTPFTPPSDSEDPNAVTGGVRSKGIVISPENKVGARLFLPKTIKPDEKRPLLIYIHGGAFAIESAFSIQYHNYVSSLVAEANIIAVSVEYRLAPEHPVPACYDDSWAVINWVTAHAKDRQGPDLWINNHADFTKVFFSGDSAGGNIAHNMAVRAGQDGLGDGVKLEGVILMHPFFGDGKPNKLWELICSDFKGWEDPRLNPMAHPGSLSSLVCGKILICISEKDIIRESGQLYYEALKKSGWKGELDLVDIEEEGHVFHLLNPDCHRAGVLMRRVVSFLRG
ncbi:2-hydroxyisoflavanone dehydratase-like [Coffea arabica]|uniref:2-hydroxyisoflavanone dehydratase-like n=1 Tax=Coffea arabica TaxID=13443 RepID=A0A6P6WET6_COFAR|nr:2-hydroxyisoflavanone dehydratase-like [Coffea arabica]XP_027112458.1 2-hydroxyisoflavanone dehydratase-like [Coffea arabica]